MPLKTRNKLMLFPKIGKIIIVVFAIAFIITGLQAWKLFRYIFAENVIQDYILIIPEEATFEQVTDSLEIHEVLVSYKAFRWVSKKKEYPDLIKPGRYLLKQDMNTNELVNMLRIGNQEPVNITFSNIRFKEDFAAAISRYIEADSAEILRLFHDTALIRKFGFTSETFPVMFIPNTYEMYWTTSPSEFARRMKIEYTRFWNETRTAKAGQLGLTPVEVSILASIVQEETIKEEEKPVVAGLYLNRLKRGIALQADPTIKYALGNFEIRRVLNGHLTIDSPYNTYKYAGLPPGPINFPEISSLEAVLHYEDHNYLYMCAREDFSGYHRFASTLAEHNRNAQLYRQALNRNKIYN